MAHTALIIVAVVVIENDKILMIEEAKPECYGTWYLPAGKVEVGESIIEAAKREVQEETGLLIEISGVFSVEHRFYPNGLDWLRFGVTGKIVGGKLKTTSDKESLQADWIPLDKLNTLELRAKDILKLIESYKNTKSLIPINFNTS